MYMLRKNEYGIGESPEYGKGMKINMPAIKDHLTEARILKIEKENLMMMEQQLMWTPDLEKDVVSYWKTLNGYWKNKKIPKCTCADFEGGFMAKEQYNGYYYEGEPCSLEYYKLFKAGKLNKEDK